MKTYRKELWFDTSQRREFINITPEVDRAVRESGVNEGLCLVNAEQNFLLYPVSPSAPPGCPEILGRA